MEITSRIENDVIVISLSGRFDSSTVKNFKSTVTSLIEKHSPNIVFDLAAVRYIDSSALGSIVSLMRSVRDNDGDIKIASLTDKIRSVFELTRLHQVFDIYDDPDVAAQSFASAKS